MLFLQDFDNVSVEYVTLPGWKASIADCRSFAALPERARAYVEEVERLLGVPGKLRCGIDLLIYGPTLLEVNFKGPFTNDVSKEGQGGGSGLANF